MASNKASPRQAFLNRIQHDPDDPDQSVEEGGELHLERPAYNPGPTGMRMHGSLARTRIVRGGVGSGKTRAATQHVDALAMTYPGSLHLVGRRDMTALKVTTQKEFLEVVTTPEVIDTFNVNDNALYYKNGSCVLFRDTKDRNKVKSLQLTSYMLDEADENEDPSIWDFLDDRLRQTFKDGEGLQVVPPYAGLLVFNPTHEEHWLYELSRRTDIDVEDFRFDTYENIKNLPPDYIPNLLRKLAPWDVQRLVHGHWGRAINGKPVYHGFTYQENVRTLKVEPILPIARSWDFGYKHPCVKWYQMDERVGRVKILKEYLGHNIYLPEVVEKVKQMTLELVGSSFPTFDYCDPHGADNKDTGPGSVDYLRVHHGIHCTYGRQRVEKGMEEIQHKILTQAPSDPADPASKPESLLLVDHSCKYTIAGYMGGYHRDDLGVPKKDGYYDHGMDVDRYYVVGTMGNTLRHRMGGKQPYRPRNFFTGY